MDKKYKIFQGRIEILWILLSLILLTLSAPEPMLAQRDTVPGPIDSMRNPSAVYCNMLGYTYRIKNSADGGQYGVCELPADTTCRAWDFLAGKCGKAYSICAKQGLEIKTLKDGKDPFLTEYAVCVNDEGNIIKSVTEMTNLLEQSGGVALNESFSMQPSTPRPEDAHTNDALPSSFDWRSYQGSNWLTPIKSQGICGSCWAFSAVGVTEAVLNIKANNPNLDHDLSEQYLVTDCALDEGACDGGSKGGALTFIRDDGIPDEACLPYLDGDGTNGCTYYEDSSGNAICDGSCCTYSTGGQCSDYQCSDRCSDWDSHLQTIFGATYLGYNPGKDTIKQAMIDHGPIAVSMNMGGNANDRIYTCSDNDSAGHAVVIVGYNDAEGYWIVRNSWGDDWGYYGNGYFNVAYDNCAIQKWPYYAGDGEPPNTNIISGPNGWIRSNSATLEWTGSDNQTATDDLAYSYKLDSGVWSAWTSNTSKTYNDLSEGAHTFHVKAKDEAGNQDESPATRSFSVDTKPATISFNAPTDKHWYNTDQTLSWTITDNGSGMDYFKWEWNDDTPDTRKDSSSGSTKLSVPGQGKHTLYVQAWDKVGNHTSVKSRGWFGYDTALPNMPTISPGCNASDNQWQNTCRDPNFSWRATDPNGDDGSGVDQYAYAWNTSSSDNPSTWGDATSHDPNAITNADGVARYYLHVKAKDVASNTSSVNTFGLWYDGSLPTATISINDDASTTNQTTIRLGLTTGDTGSGVADVRLSHNGLYWDAWQPIAETLTWILPPLDRRELPVYAQVRDGAGNTSTMVSDTITLDLYPPMPHSASYRICDDVIDAGGSVGLTSASYSLISAIGQPAQSGASANTSSGFMGRGGFLANLNGCRPISHTVTDNFDIHRWVIAAGGNLRSSASYQLGDTTGEPAASEADAFSSTTYVLSSGFWGDVTAPACPAPLTAVAVTGPVTGTVNTTLTFDAAITPPDASDPLTYTWSPAPDSGQGTAQAVYQWDSTGERTVTVEAENCGGSVSASHTVDIQEPSLTCPTPLSEVSVTGPITGLVNTQITFEAHITPADATLPVAFTWTPAPDSGQGMPQAAYQWDSAGEKTVTVAVENCGGTLSASSTVSVLLEPPSGFGVTINDGALYTNDPQVTVRTWAPSTITEMRVSNDGAYSNNGWQAYQETVAWEIIPYGEYTIPRTVYVWFKDAENQVYGPYIDDIIYDPVPPTGSVSILSRNGNQATLNLPATDENRGNSGVTEMRVGENNDLNGAEWQPYVKIVTISLSGDIAYAQFRDGASNVSPIYGSDGSTNTSDHRVYLPLIIRQ